MDAQNLPYDQIVKYDLDKTFYIKDTDGKISPCMVQETQCFGNIQIQLTSTPINDGVMITSIFYSSCYHVAKFVEKCVDEFTVPRRFHWSQVHACGNGEILDFKIMSRGFLNDFDRRILPDYYPQIVKERGLPEN